MRMYNAKDYENAVKEFDKIKAYKNSQTLMNNCLNVLYNQAVQNYNNDNYENLGSKFSFLAIYNYKDSQAKLNQIKNQIETDYMKGKIEINSFYFTYNRSGLYKLGDDLYFKIYDSYYIETIFPNESFGHTAKHVKQ